MPKQFAIFFTSYPEHATYDCSHSFEGPKPSEKLAAGLKQQRRCTAFTNTTQSTHKPSLEAVCWCCLLTCSHCVALHCVASRWWELSIASCRHRTYHLFFTYLLLLLPPQCLCTPSSNILFCSFLLPATWQGSPQFPGTPLGIFQSYGEGFSQPQWQQVGAKQPHTS